MGSTKPTKLIKFLPGHRSPDLSPEEQSGALRVIGGALEAGDRSIIAVGMICPYVRPELSALTEQANAQADAALAATLRSAPGQDGDKAMVQPGMPDLERIRQDVANRAIPGSEMGNVQETA